MAVNVKLVVDKQKNKVAFAECKGDFVDVLVSFLTLPLGTIVRLLDKKSGLRGLDTLYRSVEDLEPDYFQTGSCKSMLLEPRSAAECLCKGLAINIDDLDPRRLFRCSNWDCCAKTHLHYSLVAGVKCPYGQLMDKINLWWRSKETEGNEESVFLESAASFIVSDDLHVQVLSSVGRSISLLQNLGIMDLSMLEEIMIQVDKSQVLHLLKRSLVSETPLTDVFLKDPKNVYAVKSEIFGTKCEKNKVPVRQKLPDNDQSEGIKLKILENKSLNNAFFLQFGNDFVDLVFSFLTFPLGSALSLLEETCSFKIPGCIHHLHTSLIDLNAKEEILSPRTKDMLLNPKLPPYFSCSNQILKVDEMESRGCDIHSCKTCFDEAKSECAHGMSIVTLTELNPKLKESTSKHGGGFTRTSARFMITDSRMLKPIATASTIQLLKDLGVSSLEGLREREITITKKEALSMLMHCFTSK